MQQSFLPQLLGATAGAAAPAAAAPSSAPAPLKQLVTNQFYSPEEKSVFFAAKEAAGGAGAGAAGGGGWGDEEMTREQELAEYGYIEVGYHRKTSPIQLNSESFDPRINTEHRSNYPQPSNWFPRPR
jgi:hypothetical protein